MKFSSQEEYGLRCLIQIATHHAAGGMTIPQISEAEGLTESNVAKFMRILRLGGFVEAARGSEGGYRLARTADKILIGDVLATLGGRLFESDFCDKHTGFEKICTHSVACSVRSLWQSVQVAVDRVLNKLTLKDLLGDEGTFLTQIAIPVLDSVQNSTPVKS